MGPTGYKNLFVYDGVKGTEARPVKDIRTKGGSTGLDVFNHVV